MVKNTFIHSVYEKWHGEEITEVSGSFVTHKKDDSLSIKTSLSISSMLAVPNSITCPHGAEWNTSAVLKVLVMS